LGRFANGCDRTNQSGAHSRNFWSSIVIAVLERRRKRERPTSAAACLSFLWR
jgi:hypothetical protein